MHGIRNELKLEHDGQVYTAEWWLDREYIVIEHDNAQHTFKSFAPLGDEDPLKLAERILAEFLRTQSN